jgi:hypothetical protein
MRYNQKASVWGLKEVRLILVDRAEGRNDFADLVINGR